MGLGLRSHPKSQKAWRVQGMRQARMRPQSKGGPVLRLRSRRALSPAPPPPHEPTTPACHLKINGCTLVEPNPFVVMELLERNGDRTDPWALRWPALKIGFRALLWPVWKRYNVLPRGCTDSRLSQVHRPVLCQRRRSENATIFSTCGNEKMKREK